MKTKKHTLPIKGLFYGLIYRNITALLLIFLISISSSYFYNNYYKIVKYNYSIKILSDTVWTSEEAILEDSFGPKNYLPVVVKNFLSELPSNVREKKFTNESVILLSFVSLGDAPVEVNNFLDYINYYSRESIRTKLRTDYRAAKRISESYKDINLNNIAEGLESYPQILKIQKIEEALNGKQTQEMGKFQTAKRLNELNYHIENFDKLFNDDMYYSLNGWSINHNKLSNFDKLIAGFIFGCLASSFFLFFKSNYFRNILNS